MGGDMNRLIVVGSVADNSFAEDISQHLCQEEDCSDLISLKSFLNKEFCPRFLINENDWDNIGEKLSGKYVLIVSTGMWELSRDELAMRNFLIARAAKDNGAAKVVLLEPDLYYSAQDRGPRAEHGITRTKRAVADYKKFDGQPFTARLYADLLKLSGVDEVITVHNHSYSVEKIFMDRFSGHFYNMQPSSILADYLHDYDIVNLDKLVLCAPDEGAVWFVDKVWKELGIDSIPILKMRKKRAGEREVDIAVSDDSRTGLDDIKKRDIVVIDDMVRTGSTIIECCRLLKRAGCGRIIFFVTHFYSSREGREKLNDPCIDEIVTLNTIPKILNKDEQGRLRHKLVVLGIARWISDYVIKMIFPDTPGLSPPFYSEDMSSKNPRWKGRLGPLFSGK